MTQQPYAQTRGLVKSEPHRASQDTPTTKQTRPPKPRARAVGRSEIGVFEVGLYPLAIAANEITMYFYDHQPPHFHAQYAEHHAVIAIDGQTVLVGGLPGRALKLVAAPTLIPSCCTGTSSRPLASSTTGP